MIGLHRSLGPLLALACLASLSLARLTVDTGYAVFLGNQTRENTVAFFGIPYAEPPLGENRWRAPVPVNTTPRPSKQLVDSRATPLPCIQGTTGNGDAGGAGSEDCLKVNVYTPVNATGASNLPVLVYIHGGGYTYGNPVNWPFDHWVEQSPNVVIVSVYYRLSSFGFLAVPELADAENGALNVGFLDQIEALRWVQSNIRAFGGDPSKVTINGESAGGSSVELHLVANEGHNPLFRAAIAQSVYRTPVATAEQKRSQFVEFASKAGCGTGAVPAQLACLRKASVYSIITAADASSAYESPWKVWTPVVDNTVIADFPSRLLLEGKHRQVPVIIGATSNETLSGGTDIGTTLQGFFPQLTDADVTTLLDAYPASDFASSDLRFQTATGDSELRCARDIFVKAFGAKDQAFVYRYNTGNPTSSQPNTVFHASENWMMFLGTNTGVNGTTAFSPMNATETAFSEELIAYWLSFVRTLSPNTFKLPHSPEWTATQTTTRMVLQENTQDANASASFLETESAQEVKACSAVISVIAHEQA